MDTMRGPNLLAQEADASISKDSSIKCIFTLPRTQAGMCAVSVFYTQSRRHENNKSHVWPVKSTCKRAKASEPLRLTEYGGPGAG